MTSTNYTVGSCGMIMKSGCDTRYAVKGSDIFQNGCSTGLSVNSYGMILKNGSETGYVIRGSSIIQESDKGHHIDWMFN